MNATTKTTTQAVLAPVLAMAVFGLGLLFTVGHVQSATMHDATHDMRHATGFPCH